MQKGNLVITVGISGSGKSTWCREHVEKVGFENAVIVNRDNIRNLLFGYTDETVHLHYKSEGLGKKEKLVTKYENLLIKEGLSEGKTVLVDATHLSVKYLERFKFFNVHTELQFIESPVHIAIERDFARARKVGPEVIRKQASQLINLKKELGLNPIDFPTVTLGYQGHLPPCFIFDIDGTLAHMNNRSPYDWRKVGEDTSDYATKAIARMLHIEYDVIICTGRDGVCAEDTERWLQMNNIPYTEFHIREQNDMRPDWQVKFEMWKDIAKRYNIMGLIDDRCQVVDYARSVGLKVFQVEYNNF